MAYISTRGGTEILDFESALLAGLATDGGLYVPQTLPHFSHAALRDLAGKSYEDVAFAVIKPFIENRFSDKELGEIIHESYKSFAHIARAPLVQMDHDLWLAELHHGPTLAFKDFAMQLVGQLFTRILASRGTRLTLIGATSGDTGSAAIEAFRDKANIDVFILFPHHRVSEIQQKQMTTSGANNIHPIAIRGNFDDAQAIVKACFNDHKFRNEVTLGGINSINWARIMAQIVYYFTSALALGAPDRAVSFVVPTGNFGNIYAGFLAKKMGLPIDRLVIATNQNDILYRTLKEGDHYKSEVHPSISPSIDIQVSSNFERLLWNLCDRDATRLSALMNQLSHTGGFKLEADLLEKLRHHFDAGRATEDETKRAIHKVYTDTGMLICPHTAVGVHIAKSSTQHIKTPKIILATAHAAKFPEAVYAATGQKSNLPNFLADLPKRAERFDVLDADLGLVQNFIRNNLA